MLLEVYRARSLNNLQDFSHFEIGLFPIAWLSELTATLLSVSYSDTMNTHQRIVLRAIFTKPLPRTLDWSRVESLLRSLGARVVEGRGSRVRFELNGVVVTFHRPHPEKHAKMYQLRDARHFLEQAGVKP